MNQCPGCDHDFESPDSDEFCSSCVESGTRDAYRKGFAAARLGVQPALFKEGDIVESTPTRTACTVTAVAWMPVYSITTYNGFKSELSHVRAEIELRLQREPVVGSRWYPGEQNERLWTPGKFGEEWTVAARYVFAGAEYVSFREQFCCLVDYVKLHMTWVRDP